MSLNDRYREAEYALRKGTPIEDTPELREALITLFDAMADGYSDLSGFRPVIAQIRDRGTALGHDYWNDRHEHLDAWSHLSGHSGLSTDQLLAAIALPGSPEDIEALHRGSMKGSYGMASDGLWYTEEHPEVRYAHSECQDTEMTRDFLRSQP